METPSIIFLGSGDFGAAVLHDLVSWSDIKLFAIVTQPDKPVGRKQVVTPNPVAQLATNLGMPMLQPRKLDASFAHWLQESNVTAAIVASYGKIIPEDVLGIPKFGFLNIHPSLLPKYRGASPVAAALLHGDKETGVSVMLLDKGLDTGPVLAQERVAIPENITRDKLQLELAQVGTNLLHVTLLPYLTGTIQSQAQDNSQATLTQMLTRDDGKIDWQRSSEEIYRQFQAMHPWPGIWTTWNGKVVKLLDIDLADKTVTGIPGKAVLANHTLLVQCAQGRLQLLTLQLAGKTAQPAASFVRGYPEILKNNLGT